MQGVRTHIRTIRSWIQVLGLDALVTGLCWVGAFLVRFDGTVPGEYRHWLLVGLPVVVLARLSALFLCGAYLGALRFAGVLDLWRILKGLASSSAALSAGVFMVQLHAFPWSVLVIDGALALLGIGGVRMFYRLRNERPWRRTVARSQAGRRLLIVGAGSAGEVLLRGLLHSKQQRYVPVGFVDDAPALLGKEIDGVRVLGATGEIPGLVDQLGIEEIAVAIPSASGEVLSRIVDRCMEAGRKPKVVPDVATMIHANGQSVPLREVEVTDLLRREPVQLDVEDIQPYLRDKTVLVTGAAGSIGSELCRQILRYSPRQLVLLDQSETGLYVVDLDLQPKARERQVIPVIGDMTDRRKVERVMERYRPHVVFHAAAYKHVPLMEENPAEAVRNNVGGTITLADLSTQYGVERFVLISSDKAVQPTSMMGVSKRLCELFVLGLSRERGTRFMTTRFGNVLGSSGSVVPLFQRQIREGGPVTVTHRDMVRYFMTIPEAVQLVLQAVTLGKGGELFVLNMGREMRILDLAERLIRLSGLEPYRDIPIVFTGLRPGEKMYERLWIEGEVAKPTAHENIFVAQTNGAPPNHVHKAMMKIVAAAEHSDTPAMMELIRAFVPEYQPGLHAGLSVDTPFQRPARILVADGKSPVLGMLIRELSFGHEVITADHGELALQKVFAEQPDVVVLDAGMRGLSGHQVCSRIKSHPITRQTPVIVLGDAENAPDRSPESDGRADLYLNRSIGIADLIVALKRLLDRSSSEDGDESETEKQGDRSAAEQRPDAECTSGGGGVDAPVILDAS